MSALAQAHPQSGPIAEAIDLMAEVGGANGDLTTQCIDILRNTVKVADVELTLKQLEGLQKQRSLVGTPLSLAGRTSTGASFTLAQYRGKVVVIDFWATWCEPCVAGLPDLRKAHGKFHDKGLEIVGVDCDADDRTLNDFTAANAMPWVQLREASQTDQHPWHPLLPTLGITGIPVVFLIDRQGAVRYVDARYNLEKKIESLLKEPAN